MSNWKDTNLALFGSDVEKQVKKESALNEPAWTKVATITSSQLLVWRIKQFKLEEVKRDVGVFFRGDSYIILNVEQSGNELLYDAHFWIGRDSTQDEYGTAAYKTVELDTFLDDKAVQHREVDGCESELFLSYFPKFTALEGGYASGFKHVEAEKEKPRLLLFKLLGPKHVEIREVPFSKRSLTSEDVFIIDLHGEAIQWNGKSCNKEEKVEAASYLQGLESERCGRCNTFVCDEGDGDAEEAVKKHLPDATVPEKVKEGIGKKTIHRVSDASGEMKTVIVCEGSLPRSCLTSDDVYLIDTGKSLFVYIGDKCTRREKQDALAHAHNYLRGTNHPLAPITVVSGNRQSKELNKVLE